MLSDYNKNIEFNNCYTVSKLSADLNGYRLNMDCV